MAGLDARVSLSPKDISLPSTPKISILDNDPFDYRHINSPRSLEAMGLIGLNLHTFKLKDRKEMEQLAQEYHKYDFSQLGTDSLVDRLMTHQKEEYDRNKSKVQALRRVIARDKKQKNLPPLRKSAERQASASKSRNREMSANYSVLRGQKPLEDIVDYELKLEMIKEKRACSYKAKIDHRKQLFNSKMNNHLHLLKEKERKRNYDQLQKNVDEGLKKFDIEMNRQKQERLNYEKAMRIERERLRQDQILRERQLYMKERDLIREELRKDIKAMRGGVMTSQQLKIKYKDMLKDKPDQSVFEKLDNLSNLEHSLNLEHDKRGSPTQSPQGRRILSSQVRKNTSVDKKRPQRINSSSNLR